MNKRIWVVCIVILMFISICRYESIISYAASELPLSLEIVTEPIQKEYCIGDVFNPRGLSVLVSYSSGATNTVNAGNANMDYQYDFSTSGTKVVKISYTENGKNITTNYNVKVYDRPILGGENTSVAKGQTFHIPINISENCGVMGIQLDVNYDADCFIPLSVKNDGILSSETVNDSISTSDSGSYKIVWGGSENISDDGEIFDLEFLCKENADKESSEIVISSVAAGTYNEGYNTITFETATINVTINKSEQKKTLSNLAVFMEDKEEGEELGVPTVVGNTGEGEYTILYSDKADGIYTSSKPDKPGTYYLKIVVEETGEYESGSAICSFKIKEKSTEGKTESKKVLTEFAVIIAGWEKGSEVSKPVVLGNLGKGEVNFSYSKQENGEYTSVIPSDEGTYFIKAVVAETDNYYGAVAIGSFTISPKKDENSASVNTGGSNDNKSNTGQNQQDGNQNPATGQDSGNNGTSNNGQQVENQQFQPSITLNSKVGGFKVTAKKKALALKWNKLSEASGYEIQISTKKKFKTVTTYNIKASKNSLKIKKLKLKKKYFVRIRAYQTYTDVNGISRSSYGKWVTISKKTK